MAYLKPKLKILDQYREQIVKDISISSDDAEKGIIGKIDGFFSEEQ
jgi:hypothetical protein